MFQPKSKDNPVIKELLKTEQSYKAGLDALLTGFDYVSAQGPLTKQLIDAMTSFSDISGKLLENLKQALAEEIKDDKRLVLHQQRVGLLKLFVQNASIYKGLCKAPIFKTV